MNIPASLRYTASHEWVRTEADGTLSVGITDHAQGALGDLVYVELPQGDASRGSAVVAFGDEKTAARRRVHAR